MLVQKLTFVYDHSSIRLVQWNLTELNEIGNVIEEVVDLARQINLEVDSDGVHEFTNYYNHELAIHEFMEVHKQEQNIGELASLDPVHSKDQMTVGNLTEV
ncbi:hypothetical protein TNCV_1959541 [Trichonephila clavipes]|nr:hypothetical protein TNCV_1959541 [Trichonephila clavipes]